LTEVDRAVDCHPVTFTFQGGYGSRKRKFSTERAKITYSGPSIPDILPQYQFTAFRCGSWAASKFSTPARIRETLCQPPRYISRGTRHRTRGGAHSQFQAQTFLLLHPAAATNTIEMAPQTKSELARQVFTTSRELEYFSEAELVTQTGYGKAEWWPGVLVKELLDNALDICEQAGVEPEIRVEFTGDSLAITDNGPGIPPAVVERILDLATRTSDKAAYVSPTRGSQGNALKTVLAIPYVLNGGRPSLVGPRPRFVTRSLPYIHLANIGRIRLPPDALARTPWAVRLNGLSGSSRDGRVGLTVQGGAIRESNACNQIRLCYSVSASPEALHQAHPGSAVE
jgi:hypothetical protein